YSGFEGTDEGGQSLADILRGEAITDVDVVGIAESHCVRATTLDAISEGLHARVLTDLTVPVTPELGAAARRDMATAGAELIPSSAA
ncbi:MAG: isochorismatase family protein, partial [Cellulomonas sp.]|nr:isochorismatase family protein [Cellulomonas sp.]